MKFTTPCFIEIKDKSKILSITLELYKLGYKIEHRFLVGTAWKSCRIEIAPSKPNTRFIIIKNGVTAYISNIFAKPPHAIDCGTNVDLFLALAALREDSDYMQWWCCADENEPEFILIKNDEDRAYVYSAVEHWKATPEELIEHFKSKNP